MGNNISRRKFSKAFKQRAVQMCEARPAAEVAESLGISSGLLYKWKASAIEEGLDAFRGNGNLTAEQEELRRLRRENTDLKEENEILKKASAYFAKNQR